MKLLEYADRIEKAAPYLRNGNIARWCKTIVADMRDDAAIAPQGGAVQGGAKPLPPEHPMSFESQADRILAKNAPQATPAALYDPFLFAQAAARLATAAAAFCDNEWHRGRRPTAHQIREHLLAQESNHEPVPSTSTADGGVPDCPACAAVRAQAPLPGEVDVMKVCEALARIAHGGLQEEADAYTLGQAVGLLLRQRAQLALAPRGEP